MNKKKKVGIIIIFILIIISILSFCAYALYGVELLTDNNSISTGKVKMSYTESNEITLNNVVPTSDNKGISSTNYFEFKVNTYIKTNKEMTMNYNIVLEPLNVDSSYTKFNDSDIKVYLTEVDNNTEVLVTGPISIKMLNQYVLKSQEETFNKNDTERSTTYRLRAWLDYNFDASKINEKTYSYKFRVNVNNEAAPKRLTDQSGANAPKLTSNMIPVYYDETSDVWKKADESNVLEEYTYKLGDLDNNGKVNAADLNILLNITKCYNKKANTKECIPGDMNSDGYITEEDKNILASSKYFNKKATIEKTWYVKSDNAWYDYDDKIWANAVTVSETNRDTYLNADAGTTIPITDINTMWVWIPRYTYTYFSSSTPQEINIKFEKRTNSSGTIKCVPAINQKDSDGNIISQKCTDSKNTSLKVGVSTYTHPAFTFGSNELTGLWVGKFENSAVDIPTSPITTDSTIIIKPDLVSLKYKDISYMFKDIRQMEASNNIYGFKQNTNTTFNWDGTLTNDNNNIDIHMMKNNEWGVVAYLSHSKYGINSEIYKNNSSGYYTGRSGGNVSGKTSADSVYTNISSTDQNNEYGYYTYDGYLLNYNTNTKSQTRDLSKVASSTGNIYGIYDLSGGSNEYVMGVMVSSDGKFNVASAGNWSTTLTPSTKYYNSYSYDVSSNSTKYSTFTRGNLGDATIEVLTSSSNRKSWYDDLASFVASDRPWITRGSYYNDLVAPGAFYYHTGPGSYNDSVSTRSCLIINN